MRCIALGQAWKTSGGNVLFVSHCESDALRSRFAEEGFEFTSLHGPYPYSGDVDATMSILDDIRSNGKREKTIVVLDGYHFDEDYQQKIKNAGFRLLCIDDYGHAGRYYADFILNQNLSADMNLYPVRSARSKFLLGPRYVLLRREFWNWKAWKRRIPASAKRIIISMGGADQCNATLKIIRALADVEIPDMEVAVLLGPASTHKEGIEAALRASPFKSRILVAHHKMPEIMAWADMAIAAGGSTSWELAFMGVPSLLVIVAKNQEPICHKLEEAGVSRCLGWHDEVVSDVILRAIHGLAGDKKARISMSVKGRELIDGSGASRVARLLREDYLTFRQARDSDCSLVWKWANDGTAREASFSTEPIGWEEHVRWFDKKMTDDAHFFYILLNGDNEPVGQVRFASNGSDAVISMSIDSQFRGRGYGSRGIRVTIEDLFSRTGIATVRAHIKRTNEKSVKAFKSAGFHRDSLAQHEPDHGLEFIIRREELA
jgi:UDP-2,4-diacetamido-2,4,6-trideoxy-beta-L-altropyranose hydrolase